MIEFFKELFSGADFMPHGGCYAWRPEVVWLHVISDAVITLAYYSIPIMLWIFIRRRKDLPFNWIFAAFAIFIFGCGTTHLMEIITVWHPVYRISGIIKMLTAISSFTTAILLVEIMPMALKLRSAKELEEVNRKLEITQKEMEHSMSQLKTVNQELEAFSYSVSHDLRAPLRHIDGFVTLLQENVTLKHDATSQRHMKVISNAAKQMSTLIDDLLAFSRVGRSELHKTRVDLGTLIREVINELSHETAQRKIYWNIDKLPTVIADPAMLRLVFTNLISNALKYSRPKSEAQIEIGLLSEKAKKDLKNFPDKKIDPGENVFYVRDNGVGFDMQYADKLFGVFQRLHRADEFEGTGIGLANVQRIIHRHHGQVWADSKLNEGTTIYFTLPENSD